MNVSAVHYSESIAVIFGKPLFELWVAEIETHAFCAIPIGIRRARAPVIDRCERGHKHSYDQ